MTASPEQAEAARVAVERLQPRGLRRSAVFSWGRWAVSVLVMAIVFPVMLDRLGAATFGLWAALTAPTGMAGLLGFGVGPAIVSQVGRAIGRARAVAEGEQAAQHLHTAGSSALAGVGLSLVSAAVSLLIGWLAGGAVVDLLRVPHDQVAAATFLFRASCGCLAGMLIGAGLSALLDAVGRVDLSAIAGGVVTVSNSLFLCVAVLVAPGFRSLGWVSVATAVTNILLPAAFFGSAGVMVLAPWARVTRSSAAQVGRLALGLGGAAALGAIVDPAVKWSIAAVAGGVPVASYELATRIVLLLSGTFTALLTPMMPFLARVLTEHGPRQVVEGVARAVRRVNTVALPTIAAAAAVSGPLLALWLGEDVPLHAGFSVKVLCAGAVASLTVRSAWGALAAAGQGRRLVLVQAANLAGVGAVLGLAVGRVLAAGLAPGIAVAFGGLLGAALTLRQYAAFYGRDAAGQLLRASLVGLIAAVCAAPWAPLAALAGAGDLLQLGVSFVAWAAVIACLARKGLVTLPLPGGMRGRIFGRAGR